MIAPVFVHLFFLLILILKILLKSDNISGVREEHPAAEQQIQGEEPGWSPRQEPAAAGRSPRVQ